jgi:hypothetical protein
MNQFIIYFENATNPLTIHMMNEKGFTHENILLKAFVVPATQEHLLPGGLKTFRVDVSDFDSRIFQYNGEYGEFNITGQELSNKILEMGSEASLAYFQALFLFADQHRIWQTCIDYEWEARGLDILNIVDGIEQAIAAPINRTPALHIDLFIPEILKLFFNIELLRELSIPSTEVKSGLDVTVEGIMSFRQGNTVRQKLAQYIKNEQELPPIK